jgi:hypothetical protein
VGTPSPFGYTPESWSCFLSLSLASGLGGRYSRKAAAPLALLLGLGGRSPVERHRDPGASEASCQSVLPQGSYVNAGGLIRNLRESTVAFYRRQFERHIKPTFGRRPLHKLTAPAIEDWAYSIRESVGDATRGHATAHACYRLLRAVLSYAVRRGHLAHNPAQALRIPGVKPRKPPNSRLRRFRRLWMPSALTTGP